MFTFKNNFLGRAETTPSTGINPGRSAYLYRVCNNTTEMDNDKLRTENRELKAIIAAQRVDLVKAPNHMYKIRISTHMKTTQEHQDEISDLQCKVDKHVLQISALTKELKETRDANTQKINMLTGDLESQKEITRLNWKCLTKSLQTTEGLLAKCTIDNKKQDAVIQRLQAELSSLKSKALKCPVAGELVMCPEAFTCPITRELLIDPVITPSGFTYERENIELWISKNHTEPNTRKRLYPLDLVPNRKLKEAIEFIRPILNLED